MRLPFLSVIAVCLLGCGLSYDGCSRRSNNLLHNSNNNQPQTQHPNQQSPFGIRSSSAPTATNELAARSAIQLSPSSLETVARTLRGGSDNSNNEDDVILEDLYDIDLLSIGKGKSYVINLERVRSNRADYYARKSGIEEHRKHAVDRLIAFFEVTSRRNLPVCVMIHGFSSSHKGPWGEVADKLDATKDMVKLYIDWDTDMQTQIWNFFRRENPNFITEGIGSAYNIGELITETIQKYHERKNKSISSPIFVIAHSMGSHVAEAFIKEHKLLKLKGVIYFNPHADHTLYCMRDYDGMYMNSNNKSGFLLSFNSHWDRVLLTLSLKLKGLKYNRWPLGISKERYRKFNDKGHRVVVHNMMAAKNYFQYKFNCMSLYHYAFESKAAQDITNKAITVAMQRATFGIDAITSLVNDEHTLQLHTVPSGRGFFSGRRDKWQEYVNVVNETFVIKLNNDPPKIVSIP